MLKESRKVALGKLFNTSLYPFFSVVLALVIGAFFITALGFDWVFAYQSLLKGSLGSKNAIAETLLKTTPLIFTGLSFAIGKRCGLINLGADGQVYLGGLCATYVGVSLQGLPLAVHLPLALLAGAIGGGLLGLLTGWLKNRFNASELITGIMFNYVAIQIVSYFVTGPMKEASGVNPQTDPIAVSAQLPNIFPGTRLHAGILLAVAAIVFYYVLLWRTSSGFALRVTGLNPGAARYAGINLKKNALLSMFLAGAFGGLAGCCEILGVQLRLFQEFSSNLGFDGIAVALLGNNNPIGIFFSALLFGMLKSGSNKMQMSAQVPMSLVQIIQALVILFVVGREIFGFVQKARINKKRKAQEEG
ncbi:MAG: ABC transporter permease [Bacillota bacterium]